MATKKQAPKPEPVSTDIICSICDEPWGLHQEVNGEVSTLECIRLLKAKRQTPTIVYRQPAWYYQTPTWPYTTTITCQSAGSSGLQSAHTVGINTLTTTNTATPTVAMASAAA